jgi:arylsulfatase
MAEPAKRPNILLVLTDQERQRSWIPPHLELPQRKRLLDAGIEFTNFYTNSVPCSPSRACLFTGQYIAQHGVTENVLSPNHTELSTAVPTLGSILRGAGYRTSYVGKWHLSHSRTPDMEAYGFSDWTGDDRLYMGLSGTALEFDPDIAGQATRWLADKAAASTDPWFLTVALVNPHDVMWFPIDQPWYQQQHREEVEGVKDFLRAGAWRGDDPIPPFPFDYDEVFDELPANFDDDLFTKPDVHRSWLDEQNGTYYGSVTRDDTRTWLRMLDYYWWQHQQSDRNLGLILDALDATGQGDDTVVIFTSDHGEMCGSHGLRSKGPFIYEENMNVPLYVVAPGVTSAGAVTGALATHVDLAATVVALGGAGGRADASGIRGHDLSPILADPTSVVRDEVLFCQDMAWYGATVHTRYAIRGYFDGRVKYGRYYGVGGSHDQYGEPAQQAKRVGADAPFEDQDHELYDLAEDPFELANLANDRGRRSEARERFHELRQLELAQME